MNTQKSFFSLIALLTLSAPFAAMAQGNLNADDAVFTSPKPDGSGTQVILGIVEICASSYLWHSSQGEQIKSSVAAANERLKAAQALITGEEQRTSAIQAIKNNRFSYDQEEVGQANDLTEEASAKIELLEAQKIVSVDVRNAAIAEASSGLTAARAAELEFAKAGGAIKGISILKKVGSVLMFADMLGRIYVWNALDADPTFSPGFTYLKHTLSSKKN